MLAKKLIILLAAVAVSAPAFADRGRGHHGHRQFHHQHHHGHHVRHYPVVPVVHHYYYPPPPPPPQVVYYEPRPHNGAAIFAGAVLGAAIVHHIVRR